MTDENQDIEVTHDDFIARLQETAADDHARQSQASEDGSKMTKFLEETGLNGQAVRWMVSTYKKLAKKKGHAKAMDIIRSLEVLLPMVKNHVEGQQSEMDLDGDDTPDNVEPFDADKVAAE